MTQKKTVEVVIAQQRLVLKTDQDPARVQELADLVNSRLDRILPVSQPVSHQILLLLAMMLAEELKDAQETSSDLKSEVKRRSQAILTQLEREFPL